MMDNSKIKRRVLSVILILMLIIGELGITSVSTYAEPLMEFSPYDEITTDDKNITSEISVENDTVEATEEINIEEAEDIAAEEYDSIKTAEGTDKDIKAEAVICEDFAETSEESMNGDIDRADGDDAETYPLWVGDTQVTSANKDDIPSVLGGKGVYDADTHTLTFSGDVTGIRGTAIPKKIQSQGIEKTCMIYSKEDLKINGKAVLNNTNTDMGIVVYDGRLSINGDFTISARDVACYSYGLTLASGEIHLNAEGGISSGDKEFAVFNARGSVDILSDAEVTISAKNRRGVFVNGNVYSIGKVAVEASDQPYYEEEDYYGNAAMNANRLIVDCGEFSIETDGKYGFSGGLVLHYGNALIKTTGEESWGIDGDPEIYCGTLSSEGTAGAILMYGEYDDESSYNPLLERGAEIIYPSGATFGLVSGFDDRSTIFSGSEIAKKVTISGGTYAFPLWVGKHQVTSANMNNIPGIIGGTATFDPDHYILTFSGNVTGVDGACNGTLIRQWPDTTYSYERWYPLTIRGNVSLSADENRGIVSSNVTLEGDFSLDVEGESIRASCICLKNGTFSFSQNEDDDGEMGLENVLSFGDITVDNATVIVAAPNGIGGNESDGRMIINGNASEVSIKAVGIAISLGSNVELNGGKLIVESTSLDEKCAAIEGGLVINSGTATVIGRGEQAIGIHAEDFSDERNRVVKVNSGTLTAEGSYAAIWTEGQDIFLGDGVRLLEPEGAIILNPNTGEDSITEYFVFQPDGNEIAKRVVIGDESISPYGLYIGDTAVTEENKSSISSITGENAKASYDPVTKTLTFRNVTGITGGHNSGVFPYMIYSEDELTIKGDADFGGGCYGGIYAAEDLTIDADLTIDDVQVGVFLNKNLTLLKNLTISVSDGAFGKNWAGIWSNGGIEVRSGALDVQSDSVNIPGVRANGLLITSGTMEVYTANSGLGAVEINGTLEMQGGTLEVHQQETNSPAVTAKAFELDDYIVIEQPEGGSEIADPKRAEYKIIADANGSYSKDVKLVTKDANEFSKVVFLSKGLTVGKEFVKKGESLSAFPGLPGTSGETFVGWYHDPSFKDKAALSDVYTTDATLYARWISDDLICTVHFDYPDSYEIDLADQILEKGQAADEPNGPIICNGFRLVYWRLEGSQTPYDFNTPVMEDITLVSVWRQLPTENSFTVCFEEDTEGEPSFTYNNTSNRWEYVYTGHKLKPTVSAYSEAGLMSLGTDYKLSVSNGLNVSTKKETGIVTVTGKGQFSGKKKLKFYVVACPIADEENKPAEGIEVENIVVQTGKKIEPVIWHNGRKLTAKDYKLSFTGKVNDSVTKVDITGKGNYQGTIKDVPVKVLTKENIKKASIQVSFKPASHVFLPEGETGTVQTVTITKESESEPGSIERGELTVKDAEGNLLIPKEYINPNDPEEGYIEGDFIVSYKNNRNAGTATLIVSAARDGLIGTKILTFKIKPNTTSRILKNAETSIPYMPGGAKFGVDPLYNIGINVVDEDNNLIASPDEGKDYKIIYKNNKSVTKSKKAKYEVKFLGNYKGHPSLKGEFDVVQAGFAENAVFTPDGYVGARVKSADMVYNGKGKYESAPIVSIDDTPIKKSEYSVKYFDVSEGEPGIDITGRKITFEESEVEKLIRAEVTGKGNYKAESVNAYYHIRRANNGVINLSKAKVAAKGSSKKKPVPSQKYTGNPIEPKVDVYVKEKNKWVLVDPSCYQLIYINNVKKGKATIFVTGNGARAVGTKKTDFKIVQRSFSLFRITAE